MGLCHTKLPWKSRIIDGVSRSRSSTAVIGGYQDYLSTCLGNTSCDRSHTSFGYQFYRDPGVGVGVFQIIDQLRQILDGVNIVMRWRGDQGNTGGGMSGLRYPRIYLFARKLSALTRLCALCHLDLDLFGADQVAGGDTETSGCHLFDGGTTVQAVCPDG